MRQKIAFVCNTAWGLYNFRRGIICSLLQQGVDVVVIAPRDKYSEKLGRLGCRFKEVQLQSRGMNPIEDLNFFLELYALYTTEKPHLIFHYTVKPNIYGSFAARLLAIPSVAVVTGAGQAFDRQNVLNRLVSMLYRIGLAKAVAVWFLNDDDKRLFISNGITTEAQCSVIRSEGIDTTVFSPERFSRSSSTAVSFLMHGRLLWEKGVGEYVDAARALRERGIDAKCYLLGFLDSQNTSSVSELQVRTWEREGVISYLGVSDNVGEQISQADVVVLPSYYREGVPRALLEAAALEKPIITTNWAGCKDVVDDSVTGLLCQPKNASDLADKMYRLATMSATARLEMGKAGRQKVLREFNEDSVIESYLSLIKRVRQRRLFQ